MTIGDNKRCCAAMKDAGITDPNKQEGIDFCVNSCPYDFCVVMESEATVIQLSYQRRVYIAQELRKRKVSVDDIVLILSVGVRDVRRYLKK